MKCGKVTFFLKEKGEIVSEFNAMVAKGNIELEWIDSADQGGETSSESKSNQKGGFQRIK
jgi:hypothetical protein